MRNCSIASPPHEKRPVLIRLPPDAVPPQLLRRARLVRMGAAILGTLLHVPLILGVIALLEGRFAIAALAFAGHLLLSMVALPSLVLWPAFPPRLVALVGKGFILRPLRTHLLLQLLSLVFALLLGLLLWAIFWVA